MDATLSPTMPGLPVVETMATGAQEVEHLQDHATGAVQQRDDLGYNPIEPDEGLQVAGGGGRVYFRSDSLIPGTDVSHRQAIVEATQHEMTLKQVVKLDLFVCDGELN